MMDKSEVTCPHHSKIWGLQETACFHSLMVYVLAEYMSIHAPLSCGVHDCPPTKAQGNSYSCLLLCCWGSKWVHLMTALRWYFTSRLGGTSGHTHYSVLTNDRRWPCLPHLPEEPEGASPWDGLGKVGLGEYGYQLGLQRRGQLGAEEGLG